ncbi:tyrosine-type recombinase/integrase [Schlesneria sp. T3-172]|uniref:tyrosine-type recombinase/integrase n=1 Tax=Schlesneria sphaerica TaxID=3373610 RepID=UPI0037C79ED3
MDKRAWVHQLKKQVETKGEEKASWYVSHYDPDGILRTKSCGPGKIGKTAANKLADTIHSQLVTGTYGQKAKAAWKAFREDYDSKIAVRFDEPSRIAVEVALSNFERVAKPKLVTSITSDFIDTFVAKRLQEQIGKSRSAKGDEKQEPQKISPATINKELRYIRLVLNVAKEWKIIQTVPKIRFLKLPKRLPTFVPPEHFAAIYSACNVARRPYSIPNLEPAVWWRGLIVTAYMTGWRIGQLMALKWEDIDLEAGTAVTRAEVRGNKGKREERIPLHPLVLSHISQLAGTFDSHVFPWNQNKRDLWPEFQIIQAAAKLADGSPMPKGGKFGRWYGFHDLRRGFATMNAATMNLFELQGLMQHKSLETTRNYVNMAKGYEETVKNLFVPPNLKIGETG